uniref:Uncharacterized protein n=1 Tax=Anguilla anguilla TaxID=7936 RepID=A0A0E9Q040_ANGAN
MLQEKCSSRLSHTNNSHKIFQTVCAFGDLSSTRKMRN